jgi:diguanylate cyclase (GGDEF)-like protein
MVKNTLRKVDIFCRYGGEEFAVISTQTNAHQAYAVAEKLRQLIENTVFEYSDTDIYVTISFGVTSAKSHEQTSCSYHELIERADKALYQAKRNGRNMVIVCE